MPSFSRNLEQALHRALALANERRHEYATLEHLLLALADDQDAAAVMRACNVDLEQLKANLTDYIDTELKKLARLRARGVRYLPRVKMVLAEFRLCLCDGYRDQGDDA